MKLTLPPPNRARIELLPLIDVVFLVLVFFIYMVLSVVVHLGLPINLPTASMAERVEGQIHVVSVTADGQVALDGETIDTVALSNAIRQRLNGAPDDRWLLQADQLARHGHVVSVLNQLRSAGVQRLLIQAEQP